MGMTLRQKSLQHYFELTELSPATKGYLQKYWSSGPRIRCSEVIGARDIFLIQKVERLTLTILRLVELVD